MSGLQNGGHGRRIVEEPIEFSKRSQMPVSKAFNFKQAAKLQDSFKRKGKEDLQRRAFQVAARADRAGAEQKREVWDNSMRRVMGEQGNRWERVGYDSKHGVPRAARKRGITVEDMSNELDRRAVKGNRPGERYDSPGPFGKAERFYDPEHRRQRRLGTGIAASGMGGAGLLGYGGYESKKATDAVRTTKKGAKLLATSHRGGAALAGGAALTGLAGGLYEHSNRPGGRTWR